jgi:RimJ/RimL family protein N-acetyltransferase
MRDLVILLSLFSFYFFLFFFLIFYFLCFVLVGVYMPFPKKDVVELRVITKGEDMLSIGPKPFMEFINPFIEEKAFLSVNKKVTLEEERVWLKSSAKEIDSRQKINLVLFVNGKIAGNCEVRKGRMSQCHNVTFGLAIIKEHRHKGFGRLLLTRAISVAKKQFKPHKMWIEHVGGNIPASRLYRQVGFVKVARLSEYVFHFGEWKDHVIMEYRGK